MAHYNKSEIRRIDLNLPGGGALGAEQAGMIARIMLDPTIEIRAISGVSAGLVNGASIKQIFNKHGWTQSARELLAKTLFKKWTKSIAMDDFSAASAQTMQATSEMMDANMDTMRQFASLFGMGAFMNAALIPTQLAQDTAKKQAQLLYSQAIRQLIDTVVTDPDALADPNGIALYGEAVNVATNKGTIFSEITKDVLIASASLPNTFTPQLIDGDYYQDGACMGGSNTATEPYEWHVGDVDATLCLSTNPPYSPYRDINPRNLTAENLKETEGLILTQGLWPLMKKIQDFEAKQTHIPTHILYRQDGRVLSKKDKLDTSQTTLTASFKNGFETADVFMNAHGQTLNTRQSKTFSELKSTAKRNSDELKRPSLIAA